ncbi:hypothetical protein NDU88_004088 [Pleurodeles waltl]|uniref:Uncharacterized protein n=1 Tax=Pleurodeles waltl TaxID=8319 RepID=A0AAV7W737_PLEWA|nr:hypothetical protein NDU88_004088 [Pleurodeles waltl]
MSVFSREYERFHVRCVCLNAYKGDATPQRHEATTRPVAEHSSLPTGDRTFTRRDPAGTFSTGTTIQREESAHLTTTSGGFTGAGNEGSLRPHKTATPGHPPQLNPRALSPRAVLSHSAACAGIWARPAGRRDPLFS